MLKIYTIHHLKLNFISSKNRFFSTTATNNNKLRVLFFGTDDFASTHLKALVKEKDGKQSCIESLDLVCPPDRKTGRKLEMITPSETKGIAELNKLNIFHTPPKAKNLDDWQLPTNNTYDLGVVVSFGYFIPPHIISLFKYGAVNVHPSLLPKYRGAAPIQHAILYGDKETGVTIQELDDVEFDAGRILAQTKVTLQGKVPIYSELKEKLASIGSQLLVDTLCNLNDRKTNAISQDVSKATKAPKVKKEWSELDFVNMSAWQAEQLNRAIGQQYPLRTVYQTTKNKVMAVQLVHLFLPQQPSLLLNISDAPGTFVYDHPTKALHVVFGDGSVVACSHLKIENKGLISAKDFSNGYETTGEFGADLPVDDLIVEKNIKKRAKMIQYHAK